MMRSSAEDLILISANPSFLLLYLHLVLAQDRHDCLQATGQEPIVYLPGDLV